MKNITVDKTCWPIATYRFHGQQTLEEIEQLFESWQENIDRGEPYAHLILLEEYDANVGHIKLAAKWILSRTKAMKNLCCGAAIVAEKIGPVKLIFNTFLFITPMPFPYKTFSDRDEAEVWLRERFAAQGVYTRRGRD